MALDEPPPFQRQELEGKNTNELGKSILESWKLTAPQSYYQVKTKPPKLTKFAAIRTEIPNPTSTLKTWPTNGGIEKQQKFTSTELQKILDRITWTNNVHAQLDPPQEPIQPPPNLENIPKDETSRKMGQPNRPQRTRKLQKW